MSKPKRKYPEHWCCICGKKIKNGICSSFLRLGWCNEHSKYYPKGKNEEAFC